MANQGEESDSRPGGERARLERWARRLVQARFGAAGWEACAVVGQGPSPDLLLQRGEQRLAVQLKASPGSPRRAVLPSLLADAMLRAGRGARDRGARPLAVIAAPALSAAMVKDLEEYARAYGDGCAWGVVDERGRFQVWGEGLESIESSRPKASSASKKGGALRERSSASNPFSDLGQWMSKVLLAPDIPPEWLNAPRAEVHGVSDLARLAGVSDASASKFVSAMESRALLSRESGRIEVVQRDLLMKFWSGASQGVVAESPARFVLPANDPLERLQSVLREQGRDERQPAGRPRACLALFSACDALGVGIVRGAPRHIYVDDMGSALIDELGLMFVGAGEVGDVLVRQPRFPESVLRAAVLREGVPVADILQCWLDVGMHPARGHEQMMEIRQRLGQHRVFE